MKPKEIAKGVKDFLKSIPNGIKNFFKAIPKEAKSLINEIREGIHIRKRNFFVEANYQYIEQYNYNNNSYQNQLMFNTFNNNHFNQTQNFQYPNSNNNFNNIQNYNQNQINNSAPEINNEQPKHLRGLVNIASTCYMNSIIQCFAHIEELILYFEKPKMVQLIEAPENREKLFPVFVELIKLLWDPYDPSPLHPYIFKERLGKMNPLFQGPIPNDAKDLLTYLLMQLHEELNNPKNINNNNMNQNIMINAYMQQNKKIMLNSFVQHFENNYRSIISELFYGLIYNQTQCQFCKTIIYNYQTMNFLIFPLVQVLNYKMQLVNFQNNYNNTVTLEDCFKYNQNIAPLNDYYCNNCKKTSNALFANFISVSPNIIIIILNRGVGLQYKVRIDFEENLNLKNYVEFFKDEAFYELIGVVTHYGESGASGHFMARCKSPIDGFWYLYNDAIIQKLEYFTKENFLQGNPYILFYKKIKLAK